MAGSDDEGDGRWARGKQTQWHHCHRAAVTPPSPAEPVPGNDLTATVFLLSEVAIRRGFAAPF